MPDNKLYHIVMAKSRAQFAYSASLFESVDEALNIHKNLDLARDIMHLLIDNFPVFLQTQEAVIPYLTETQQIGATHGISEMKHKFKEAAARLGIKLKITTLTLH